jgi:hypothetical protein
LFLFLLLPALRNIGKRKREREREVGGKRGSKEKEMKRKYRQPDTRYTENARRII